MNTALVTVNTQPEKGSSRSVAVPVALPDLQEVRAFAERLHQLGQSYQDRVWGWELSYEPEINEPEAEVQVPDGQGGFVTETMDLWAPASFAIGESGIWFFSMLWENGTDQPPVEFLDDRNLLPS
ncbi:MAG: hypothetical protein KDE53_12215 [Caldilineaceae bacterium]|nr:hypothetical protein [Caldilineaceae bacterium]